MGESRRPLAVSREENVGGTLEGSARCRDIAMLRGP